jgi:hypothetical protein
MFGSPEKPSTPKTDKNQITKIIIAIVRKVPDNILINQAIRIKRSKLCNVKGWLKIGKRMALSRGIWIKPNNQRTTRTIKTILIIFL